MIFSADIIGLSASTRRMVMYYPPAICSFPQNQGEQPARRSGAQCQLVAATDHGAVRAKELNVQVAKSDFAHLFAVGLVILLVALENGIVSLNDCAAGIVG